MPNSRGSLSLPLGGHERLPTRNSDVVSQPRRTTGIDWYRADWLLEMKAYSSFEREDHLSSTAGQLKFVRRPATVV